MAARPVSFPPTSTENLRRNGLPRERIAVGAIAGHVEKLEEENCIRQPTFVQVKDPRLDIPFPSLS